MKSRFISWLKQVVIPDIKQQAGKLFWKIATRKVTAQLAEDARKIGVNAIGIGLIGVVVNSDAVPRSAGLIVFTMGVIIWLIGLMLTSSEPDEKE
ncbi:hypothetical protein [Alcaligenes faecalis]|uniref:Uncharacterized protein n=1 Tax=Alcaligenes faecalis TaxID=511 RepID=A0A1Z3MKZ2_ALCFA|nr:hypothetical protein [Alcaligenes faecalis]ASD48470.1 hypothetical protein [Alcaligenes faecalis]OSZ33010.1 hypothetical protein BVZ28_13380 [Alcaligenes faecalis]OSZ41161.1 hypothetical protein BVZ29_13360 [Alcaligenes faecalis]RSE57582.1 hypothetical protein EGT81_19280 [Alcaligenes faecalis]WHQ45883.1 hypothetical protein E8D21_19695 [Alcaligenes faecalis]